MATSSPRLREALEGSTMTMHVPRIMTAGEKALLALMDAAAADGVKGETARIRKAAADVLRAEGLPSRKVEAWHYTDLRNLLRSIPGSMPVKKGRALVKGSAVAGEDEMPAGVVARALSGDIVNGDETALIAVPSSTDTVGMVSAAFASSGHEMRIAPGITLGAPVELRGHGGHHVNRIHVGDGATAVLVESASGGGLSSILTSLTVGSGASVIYVIDQETAEDAVHFARLTADIGENASLLILLLNAGGVLTRREFDVVLSGEGGDFKLRGMNLLSGKRHADVTMVVRHVVEHTTSTEFLRNVVTGEGRGVFQGQIRVAAQAQKTDARMACNTLLLSDDGEFLAKPELEIFADDVACGHGATVAEINRDHLFYLMARGVPEAEARAMLVKAFVAELVDEIEDEALHDALYDRLSAWLATH
jgi:Fe-S cluster assembly protein SufD